MRSGRCCDRQRETVDLVALLSMYTVCAPSCPYHGSVPSRWNSNLCHLSGRCLSNERSKSAVYVTRALATTALFSVSPLVEVEFSKRYLYLKSRHSWESSIRPGGSGSECTPDQNRRSPNSPAAGSPRGRGLDTMPPCRCPPPGHPRVVSAPPAP